VLSPQHFKYPIDIHESVIYISVCVFGEFAGRKRSRHVEICKKKKNVVFLCWKKHFAQEMMMTLWRWAGALELVYRLAAISPKLLPTSVRYAVAVVRVVKRFIPLNSHQRQFSVTEQLAACVLSDPSVHTGRTKKLEPFGWLI
jgi:hypothetical protein